MNFMRRKIFKKSNQSKIRLDLKSRSANWWLRSSYSYYNNDVIVSDVDEHGSVRLCYTYDKVIVVAPVCTI